jgi:hypothetical protein
MSFRIYRRFESSSSSRRLSFDYNHSKCWKTTNQSTTQRKTARPEICRRKHTLTPKLRNRKRLKRHSTVQVNTSASRIRSGVNKCRLSSSAAKTSTLLLFPQLRPADSANQQHLFPPEFGFPSVILLSHHSSSSGSLF